jgi:LysR family nitrogen assimilation transcriptional regulator
MDIRQLRYFVAVASHENFSKAAQQLYIAQPALSRSMRALEDELGVRLFERHIRGATLTPEGRHLLERAHFMLRSFDEIRAEIGQAQARPSGPIVVGMTPNFALMIGAELALRIRQHYPGAQLRIVEAYSPSLRDQLRSGGVDIAILSGAEPATRDGIGFEPLFEDRLCLVGKAGDPLLAQGELAPTALHRLPLILTGITSAGIRNELETLAARRRLELDVAVEVGSVGLATQMIQRGMGYTIYIEAGVTHDRSLASAPVRGLWLRRSLGWPVNRPLSRLAAQVLPLTRALLLEQVHSGAWPGARPIKGKRRER